MCGDSKGKEGVMKRTITFFSLYSKRLFKKPAFVIILLLMPVLTIILSKIIDESDDTLRVGLVQLDDNPVIAEVIKELTSAEKIAQFYVAESEAELKEEILRDETECGFVFKEGAYESMLTEKNDPVITMYDSSKSTVTDYMKETVFASIFERLSRDRLVTYIDGKDYMKPVDKESRDEYMTERYNAYIEEGGVFEVYYTNGDERVQSDTTEVAGDKSYLKKPIYGFLAIFVMIAALSGAVFYAIDARDGIYKTLSYKERPYVNLVTVVIPTVLALVVSYICVLVCGIGDGALREGLKSISYGVILIGCANLLRSLIANEVILCSVLPMLTVVSFVCCNIIVNTAFYFQPIEYIRWFLPANYYLETVKSVSGIALTVAIGLVLTVLGIIIDKRKKM